MATSSSSDPFGEGNGQDGHFLQHSWFVQSTHEYVREYIRLADQKSAFVFGAGTAVLAFLYRASTPQKWISIPRDWNGGNLLALLAMVVLGVAGASAIGVVKPRGKGSRSGLIFWDAIAERESGSDYAADVVGSSDDDLLRERLKHTFDLAKVCQEKYRWLRWSFRTFAVGLVLAIIYFLVCAPIQTQ